MDWKRMEWTPLDYTTETRPESFPCIICGKTLYRAFEPYEQQPNDGIMCETGGNYGSTVFDSMDGERLAFNICDECMVAAAKKGRVMSYQKFRHITVDIGHGPLLVVGHEDLERPYVPWNPRLEPDNESICMTIDELEHLPKHCHLHLPVEDIKQMVAGNQDPPAATRPPRS